jgi:hypothetical protein
MDSFHNAVIAPIVTENHTGSLAKKCLHDLKCHAIHLPSWETAIRTIIAF